MDKAARQALKQEVRRDHRQAIQKLYTHLNAEAPQFNDLVLLESQERELEIKFGRGLLTNEEYHVRKNKLRQALIHLIDQVGADDSGHLPASMQAVAARHLDFSRFPWQEKTPFFLETFDLESVKAFENYQEEKWSARLAAGLYTLENKADAKAVKYHYLKIDDREMAPLPVAVEVKVASAQQYPSPSGGLIFCFDRSTAYYYAFIVSNDRQFTLWRKSARGYRTLISGRSAKVVPHEFNRLGIIRSKREIYLFINDQFERKVKESEYQTGDSGIIAVGQGQFVFDNLAFYEGI